MSFEFEKSRVAALLRRGMDENVIRLAIDLIEQDEDQLDQALNVLEEAADAPRFGDPEISGLADVLFSPPYNGPDDIDEAAVNGALTALGAWYAGSLAMADEIFADEVKFKEAHERRQELAPHNPFVRR